MTVGELKKILEEYNDDMNIVIYDTDSSNDFERFMGIEYVYDRNIDGIDERLIIQI